MLIVVRKWQNFLESFSTIIVLIIMQQKYLFGLQMGIVRFERRDAECSATCDWNETSSCFRIFFHLPTTFKHSELGYISVPDEDLDPIRLFLTVPCALSKNIDSKKCSRSILKADDTMLSLTTSNALEHERSCTSERAHERFPNSENAVPIPVDYNLTALDAWKLEGHVFNLSFSVPFTESLPSSLNYFQLGLEYSIEGSCYAIRNCTNHCSSLCKMSSRCSTQCGLNCQFEGPCAWEWEEKEGFVLVSSGNLTSPEGDDERTAPLQDASGNPDGHYLYYGVKSTEGVHHAKVVSPWFEKTSGKFCTVEVWLHMFNMEGSTFNIIVHTDATDWHLMSVPGNNLNEWRKYSQPVGQITQPFRLQMEVYQEHPKVPAHLAVDNIQVIDCVKRDPSGTECGRQHFLCTTQLCIEKNQVCDLQKDCLDGEDEEMDCDEVPPEARCNFEEGTCGWTAIAGDSPAEWVLQNGSFVASDSRRQRPPTTDHTYGNASGTYILAKFHKKISKMVDSTHFRSPLFSPIPYYHRSVHSAYYNSCQIRVFYHMFGPHMGEMAIFSVEQDPHYAEGKRDLLTRVFGNQGNLWKKLAVSLPDISKKYFIEFTVTRGARHMELALDDITLSPECFGIGVPENESRVEPNDPIPLMDETSSQPLTVGNRYTFSTCGSIGVAGPTIQQCRKSYVNTSVAVSMTKDSRFNGMQFWTVPETGYYSIFAKGASGGQGVKNVNVSRGAVVRASFNLTRGEKITILVGQKGTSACDSVKGSCLRDRRNKRGKIGELNSLVRGPIQPGGGGGGGGATIIFKVQFPSRTNIPLLVAGGGGGLSAISELDNYLMIDSDGRGINNSVDPTNGRSSTKGAGAGGGWNDTTVLPSSGRSLLEGGRGGQVCAEAHFWQTNGGFGGGGGGCANGGGGGGYRGGDVSEKNHAVLNGQGGTSYINPDGSYATVEAGQHEGDGYVEILPARNGCGCFYQCLPLRMEPWDFLCICPFGKMLHPDGVSCIEDPTPKPPSPLSTHHLVVIILCILVTVAVILFFFFLACKCRPLPWRKTFKDCMASILRVFFRQRSVNRYRKKQSRDLSHEPLSNPEVQLSRLRQTAGGMVTEYNPNYEFGGSTCTLQDLREIPRENLTLVKALGQGAFGEVYQGYLSNVPGEIIDISVAVKTLPEVSSSQAELDFTMEALIMSKFSHINIVRFLGVCFEKMPRFLVLELLPGGDLKSFLRESRPKPNKPSPLTMVDLLNLAIDVAKGCNYLEENHFIHRDIAARNCLLTKKGPGRTVKIADFGMARDIYRADYYRKGGKAMLPVKWMPPEAFLDGVFTSKTDIWSFGVLLWEVMSLGYMPYPGRGNQDVMQLVTSGGRLEPPANCPSPAYHIMMQCWHPIPEQRPSFITILERLGYCLQDPDVLNAPLPVFHRPPSMERDMTVMRPHDSDTCLQVQRQDRDLQSPGSEDYLIPMPSSNYSLSTERTELQSASSVESVDKLLELDENQSPTPSNALIPNGGATWETSFMGGKPGYVPVPTVDNQNWNPSTKNSGTAGLGERTSSQQSLDALPIAPDLTQALKANEADRMAALDASALNRQLNNRPLPYVNVDVNSNSGTTRAVNQNTPFTITAGPIRTDTADAPRHNHYPPSRESEINC